jgi:hypothetical protein
VVHSHAEMWSSFRNPALKQSEPRLLHSAPCHCAKLITCWSAAWLDYLHSGSSPKRFLPQLDIVLIRENDQTTAHTNALHLETCWVRRVGNLFPQLDMGTNRMKRPAVKISQRNKTVQNMKKGVAQHRYFTWYKTVKWNADYSHARIKKD